MIVLETVPQPEDFDAVARALRLLRTDRLMLDLGAFDLRGVTARVGLLDELLEDLEVRRDLADLQTWNAARRNREGP